MGKIIDLSGLQASKNNLITFARREQDGAPGKKLLVKKPPADSCSLQLQKPVAFKTKPEAVGKPVKSGPIIKEIIIIDD